MKKIISRILIILVFIAVLFIIIFSAALFSGVKKATSPDRKILLSSPEEAGLYFDSFETENENGKIRGWYIPCQKNGEKTNSDKTVIFSHDYSDNMEGADISAISFYKVLTNNGYNVITFDYTGSGASDGKGYTFGQSEETNDLSAVISYARENFPESRLSLFGFGFGANSVINSASKNDVDIIICDSPYSDLSKVFDQSIDAFTTSSMGIYNYFLKKALIFTKVEKNLSPEKALSEMKDKKILFIQSENDTVFPENSARRLYEISKDANTVYYYTAQNSEHCYGLITDGINYQNYVLAFLEEAYK